MTDREHATASVLEVQQQLLASIARLAQSTVDTATTSDNRKMLAEAARNLAEAYALVTQPSGRD